MLYVLGRALCISCSAIYEFRSKKENMSNYNMNDVFLYRCFSRLQHLCHVDFPLFTPLSTSIAQTEE